MLRPSLLNSPSRRAVGRNLALDVTVAIGAGVSMSLVGALLPTIARLDGLDPIGLSALAAAPFVANFLGAFAGQVGPRSVAQLSLMRGIGAAALLALFVSPTAATAVLASAIFWLSLALSGPFHFRLWGAMYPARSLGRVMGLLGMTRAGAGAIAAIGGGLLADRIGGSQAVAVVGAIAVVCAIAYAGFRATTHSAPALFSPRESVRALFDQPELFRLVMGQMFYGGGVIAATPLFALVYVDRLHMSIADVGLVGVLTAVANTLTYPMWGAFADRRGGSRTLALGSSIGVASVLAYALAPNVAVLWMGAVAAGVAGGAIDLGINAAVSTETPMTTRAAAMAGWNAITGPRGIVAAFLMSVLIQLRVVDVTGGLLLCAGIATVGAGIYIWAQAGSGRRSAAGAPLRGEAAAGASVPAPLPSTSAAPARQSPPTCRRSTARRRLPPAPIEGPSSPQDEATPAGLGGYDSVMRLTAWEEERLLIFSAAELARRHRDAAILLSAPEAVAVICDAMLEAARAGSSYADVEAAGRRAVAPRDVIDGVRELVDEVRLEVLVGDGTRLVVLTDPLGGGRPMALDGPGAIVAGSGAPERPARERLRLMVRSESRRTIRVSSHVPFDRVNARLAFDRTAAAGFRLDLPAGSIESWAPGESKTVGLVRYSGAGGDR